MDTIGDEINISMTPDASNAKSKSRLPKSSPMENEVVDVTNEYFTPIAHQRGEVFSTPWEDGVPGTDRALARDELRESARNLRL